MTFKQLVRRVADIRTFVQYNVVCGEVDFAYQKEKISWTDHELLYSLLGMVYWGIGKEEE